MSRLLKFFHVTAWSILLFIAKPVLAGLSLLQVLPVHHINWFDLSIILLGGVGLLLGFMPQFRIYGRAIQGIIFVLKMMSPIISRQPQPVARVITFETLKHADETGAKG